MGNQFNDVPPNQAKCLTCGTPLGVGGGMCPNKNCKGCFSARTRVLTPTGWETIENISEGDHVLSINLESNALTENVVSIKRAFCRRQIWELGTSKNFNPIETTESHSFFTASRGWRKTSKLGAGDVLTAANERGEIYENLITSVSKTSQYQDVYNLIVDGSNTFIVEGSLVHSFSYFRNIRAAWVRAVSACSRDLVPAYKG